MARPGPAIVAVRCGGMRHERGVTPSASSRGAWVTRERRWSHPHRAAGRSARPRRGRRHARRIRRGRGRSHLPGGPGPRRARDGHDGPPRRRGQRCDERRRPRRRRRSRGRGGESTRPGRSWWRSARRRASAPTWSSAWRGPRDHAEASRHRPAAAGAPHGLGGDRSGRAAGERGAAPSARPGAAPGHARPERLREGMLSHRPSCGGPSPGAGSGAFRSSSIPRASISIVTAARPCSPRTGPSSPRGSVCLLTAVEPGRIAELGRPLLDRLELDHLVVTCGADGLVVVTRNGSERVTAVPRRVSDVTGAGDTVAAVLAVALGAGADPQERPRDLPTWPPAPSSRRSARPLCCRTSCVRASIALGLREDPVPARAGGAARSGGGRPGSGWSSPMAASTSSTPGTWRCCERLPGTATCGRGGLNSDRSDGETQGDGAADHSRGCPGGHARRAGVRRRRRRVRRGDAPRAHPRDPAARPRQGGRLHARSGRRVASWWWRRAAR